jgi:hypothetical protein
MMSYDPKHFTNFESSRDFPALELTEPDSQKVAIRTIGRTF